VSTTQAILRIEKLIVVQLPMLNEGGATDMGATATESQLEERWNLQGILQREVCDPLRQGRVDGGDCGGGTMNIFIDYVTGDVEKTVDAIIAAMRSTETLREGTVIACGPADGSRPMKVVWPKAAHGNDFMLFGIPDGELN